MPSVESWRSLWQSLGHARQLCNAAQAASGRGDELRFRKQSRNAYGDFVHARCSRRESRRPDRNLRSTDFESLCKPSGALRPISWAACSRRCEGDWLRVGIQGELGRWRSTCTTCIEPFRFGDLQLGGVLWRLLKAGLNEWGWRELKNRLKIYGSVVSMSLCCLPLSFIAIVLFHCWKLRFFHQSLETPYRTRVFWWWQKEVWKKAMPNQICWCS